jgi:hypothetical protein
MTTKTNTLAAQKKRKQTIILAVLGVVLLVMVAIQGPKLLGGSDEPAAEAAPAGTTADGTTVVPGATGATTAGSTPQTTTVPPGTPRAVLVGVPVGGGVVLKPGEGQLRRFTLFTAKDPFVQTLPKEPTAGTPAKPESGGSAPADGGSQGGGGSESAPTPAAPGFATIAVNGDPEALKVKQLFPEQDDLFVLVSLKGKTAKIAVSGGAFTDGQTITLKLGKNLTLVNTATGARYALKLLYVGEQPEEVQGFTQAEEPKK